MNKYIIILLSALVYSCNQNTKIKVIGHRGAKGHIAENTIPSIKKAIELGADMVEIDVFKIKSGEIVVFHDTHLERLTQTKGAIEKLTLDELNKIKVEGIYKIPLLHEVLELINGKIQLNIELKGANTASGVNTILQNYIQTKALQLDHILISSFKWGELKEMRKLNPEIKIAVLTSKNLTEALPVAKKINAVAINPKHTLLTTENVEQLKKHGLKIYPWTVNNSLDIQKMIDLGVDGIITDYPDKIATN